MTALAASLETALMQRARADAARKGRSQRAAILGGRVAVAVLFLGLWDYASGRWIDWQAVSDPVAVLTALGSLIETGRLWPDLAQTLLEVGSGFAIGAAAGVALAVIATASATAQLVLRPFLLGFYAIPKIALAPLIIMWFGLDTAPKIILAAIFVVFIVFMTTVAGIEAINTQHVNIVRVMGAGRFGIMRKIVLPSALPFLITGLRLAIPEALIGAVIGEFIASDAGVGHLVDAAASQFNMAVSLAGIVVLLAIVAVSDGVLSVFERRVMRWSPAARIGHA